MYMSPEWVENLSMSLHNLIASSLRYVPLPSMFLLQEQRTRQVVSAKDASNSSKEDALLEVRECTLLLLLCVMTSCWCSHSHEMCRTAQEIQELKRRLGEKENELRSRAASTSNQVGGPLLGAQRRSASIPPLAAAAVAATAATTRPSPLSAPPPTATAPSPPHTPENEQQQQQQQQPAQSAATNSSSNSGGGLAMAASSALLASLGPAPTSPLLPNT